MAGIAFLRRLLMKQAMKKSAGSSGIMTLNKGLADDVERQIAKWVDSAKRQGQDIDKMGAQELKYIVELNKPKKHTLEELIETIGLNDPKKNKFLQKEGKVIQADFGGGITDIVTETITKIKTLKPIDAMKEANSVIGRKGKYKRLTPKQSKKILQDTEDHIFERDIKYDEFGEIIKPDPEDLAQGGRTGTGLNYLLGEDDQNVRMPFGAGGFGRRAFLKLMAGAGAGVGAAKTGLFGLLKGGGKKKVVEEVVKQSAGSGTPPAYFFNLVKKIKNLGDDITEKGAIADRQKVTKFKDYELTEDLATGRQEIQRYRLDEGNADAAEYYGKSLTEETYMSYTPGEIIKGKKGKPVKTQPEYEEGTAYLRNDRGNAGEIVEESATISDDVIKEGTVFEDTISEFTKKASGGRVSLSAGGLAGMLGE